MNAGELMVEAPTIDKSSFLSSAVEHMEKEDTRRLLVVSRGEFFGLVTLRDIMRVLGSRRKGSKSASSLRVATAVSQNFARVLPQEQSRNCVTLLRDVDSLVVMEGDGINGIITPQEVMQKLPVSGMAAEHCSHPPTVDVSDRMIHARRLMLDGNLSRLPVTDKGKLVSIITEKHVAKALYRLRESGVERYLDNRLDNLLIGDVVRFGMVTAQRDATLQHVARLMVEKEIGAVPLVDDNGALMGVVTRRDVIRAM